MLNRREKYQTREESRKIQSCKPNISNISKNSREYRVSERKLHSTLLLSSGRNIFTFRFSTEFAAVYSRCGGTKRSYRRSMVHVACVRITCPAVASRVAAARVQRYTGTKRGPGIQPWFRYVTGMQGETGEKGRGRGAERKNRARLSCTANELSLLFCTVVNLPRICRNEEETSRKDSDFLPEIRQMSKKRADLSRRRRVLYIYIFFFVKKERSFAGDLKAQRRGRCAE